MSDALERAVTRTAWEARQQEVRDLHSEIATLKAERDKWATDHRNMANKVLELEVELDASKAECAALKAERRKLLGDWNKTAAERDHAVMLATKAAKEILGLEAERVVLCGHLRVALEEILLLSINVFNDPRKDIERIARRALDKHGNSTKVIGAEE